MILTDTELSLTLSLSLVDECQMCIRDRGLSGKELHAGQISHQGNDFVAGLVRLFAVGLNRGNDKLMNIGSLPLRMSLGSQQTNFRVAPCPEAKAIKPAICFLVLFMGYFPAAPGGAPADRGLGLHL